VPRRRLSPSSSRLRGQVPHVQRPGTICALCEAFIATYLMRERPLIELNAVPPKSACPVDMSVDGVDAVGDDAVALPTAVEHLRDRCLLPCFPAVRKSMSWRTQASGTRCVRRIADGTRYGVSPGQAGERAHGPRCCGNQISGDFGW